MFTYSGFTKIINTAQNNGYRFAFFREVEKYYSKVCMLRHDVDNSPEAALEMAKLEFKLGVKATYFFMVTSEVYNILSPGTREIVSKIKHLGHEIGLHFSEAAHKKLVNFNKTRPKRLIVCVDNEAEIIEKIAGKSVRVVSFHQPSKWLIQTQPVLKDRLNTYRPQDIGNAYYLSDSNMHWRGQDPWKIFSSKKYNKVQVLIHPMWWRKSSGSIRQRWGQVLEDRVSAIWQSWQSKEDSVGHKWPEPKLRS